MKMFRYFFSFVLSLFFVFTLQAQMFMGVVKGMFVEVKTMDGMQLIGTVFAIDESTVTLEHETYGRITIKSNKIKKIDQINQKTQREDGYWHENKNYSRNYYGPTGMGLEKGRGYYQNIMLGWNHLAYAFTDYFTLGVDFEIISILVRLSGEQPWDSPMPVTALTPKFSYSANEDIHFGLGTIALFVPSTDHYFDAGISYGVFTYGNKDRSATFGFGIPFFEADYKPRTPIFTLSGQYRLSPTISLLSENWLVSVEDDPEFFDDNRQTVYIGIQGMRYLARELTWDFGIVFLGVSGEEGIFFPIPYISVVFPFDRTSKK